MPDLSRSSLPVNATARDRARLHDEPRFAARRDRMARLTETRACRLILGFLADDPAERASMVLSVASESGLSADDWELTTATAATAATFWRSTDPEKARRLLQSRLVELAGS